MENGSQVGNKAEVTINTKMGTTTKGFGRMAFGRAGESIAGRQDKSNKFFNS